MTSTAESLTFATRFRAPALVALGGAAAFTALRVRDPHTEGSWGLCPFLWLTGRPCPGCGGLRAVNDLTHGDVAAAVSSNVLVVALVAVLAVAWVVWIVRTARGVDAPMIRIGARTSWILVGVVVVFGVVRNLPFGAWLAP